MEAITEIVNTIEHMMEDDGIPKSVNVKLKCMKDDLQGAKELSLCLNKALSDLEELSEDVNIPVFIRTQLWGVISQLAALEARIVKA